MPDHFDIANLIIQPEGQYFDRKSLWHGPEGAKRPRNRRDVRDEIARYVAAFANADGGTEGHDRNVVDPPRQSPNPPELLKITRLCDLGIVGRCRFVSLCVQNR